MQVTARAAHLYGRGLSGSTGIAFLVTTCGIGAIGTFKVLTYPLLPQGEANSVLEKSSPLRRHADWTVGGTVKHRSVSSVDRSNLVPLPSPPGRSEVRQDKVAWMDVIMPAPVVVKRQATRAALTIDAPRASVAPAEPADGQTILSPSGSVSESVKVSMAMAEAAIDEPRDPIAEYWRRARSFQVTQEASTASTDDPTDAFAMVGARRPASTQHPQTMDAISAPAGDPDPNPTASAPVFSQMQEASASQVETLPASADQNNAGSSRSEQTIADLYPAPVYPSASRCARDRITDRRSACVDPQHQAPARPSGAQAHAAASETLLARQTANPQAALLGPPRQIGSRVEFDVATTIDGRLGGTLTLLIDQPENAPEGYVATDILVRLSDVVRLFESRMQPDLFRKLVSAKSANLYVTLSQMRASGIGVAFDNHDRLVFSLISPRETGRSLALADGQADGGSRTAFRR